VTASSRAESFRRAGHSFTREASTVTVDKDQLKMLEKDSMIVVEKVEDVKEKDDKKKPATGGAK
ncbi:MAG: hypothetical protein KAR06_01855, partial [Deltaproteobacteria bacterium]|nr:hypothetical protein [Deltaproteobacteria bacterium]